MITNADFSKAVEERNALAAENKRLRDAAQAVIERWESPAWIDSEPTAAVIYRLRDILWPNAVMSQPAKGSALESPAGSGLAP